MIFQATKRRLWYMRKNAWKRARLLFPSPAEVHFMKLMGARTIVFDGIRYPNGNKFPFTIVYNKGRTLRRNYMQREVRVGGFYVDFAFVDSYRKLAIEIDGAEFHIDHVRERERDAYLKQRGWSVMHIAPADMYRNPGNVQQRVLKFLAN